MNSQSAASLINVLGFLTGTALYGMLLAMTLRVRQRENHGQSSRLPLLTAVFGLIWNLGSFAAFGLGNLHTAGARVSAEQLFSVAAFAALGFLPAVVVHSVLRNTDRSLAVLSQRQWPAFLAYGLSVVASLLHLLALLDQQTIPSHIALHLLSLGFAVLIVALLLLLREQSLWRQAGWLIALAVFTVSAQHLSHHDGDQYPWWLELIGHHSSLPLAFVILYQDYRFALADLFLKRALTLVILVAVAGGVYALTIPLWSHLLSNEAGNSSAAGLLLALWLGLTLCYPLLQRSVQRFVDTVILRRADYEALRNELAHIVARHEESEPLLDDVGERLRQALTARDVWWQSDGDCSHSAEPNSAPLLPLVQRRRRQRPQPLRAQSVLPASSDAAGATEAAAEVLIPTSDAPRYRLFISPLSGERRLLSDDLAMLDAVALLVARRLDALRVTQERFAHSLREQEMSALATEAELRALRAQLNPHFLFNALTTIGWLIQSAPERALDTLMKLTNLLRGVLRHSDEDLTTLGAEIELIEAYLEIERARFEDRLRVLIDVPAELRSIRLPALLIQPLVENAIKHGISPQRAGGEVIVQARHDARHKTLTIRVSDTGAGVPPENRTSGHGIGLTSVERRLKIHYEERATFSFRSAPGIGTTVELSLPVRQAEGQTEADSWVATTNVRAFRRKRGGR